MNLVEGAPEDCQGRSGSSFRCQGQRPDRKARKPRNLLRVSHTLYSGLLLLLGCRRLYRGQPAMPRKQLNVTRPSWPGRCLSRSSPTWPPCQPGCSTSCYSSPGARRGLYSLAYSLLGCKIAIHHHPGFPQCGQSARTTRRHSTPFRAEISCWQWRQFAQCSLSSSRSSAASSRQSGHPATRAGSSV